MLDVERQYFAANLPSLLAQYRGQYVVIKNDVVVGGFATPDEALREGARRFGLQSFLTRRVEDNPVPVSIPALTLGVLHADPPRAILGAGDEPAGTTNRT